LRAKLELLQELGEQGVRIICLLLLWSLLLEAEANELTVGLKPVTPFSFYNKEGELAGLDIEFVNAIAKQANLTIEYEDMPWKRVLKSVETGEVDLTVGASFSEERDKYAYFSIPYREEIVHLIIKRGMNRLFQLNSLTDLFNGKYIIGIEDGYYYGSEFEALRHNARFRSRMNEVIDLNQNVNMLLKSRIDGFLAEPEPLKHFLDQHGLYNQFEVHPFIINRNDVALMLSRKSVSRAQVDAINQAIKALISNGELKKIVDKWQVRPADNNQW